MVLYYYYLFYFPLNLKYHLFACYKIICLSFSCHCHKKSLKSKEITTHFQKTDKITDKL